MKLFRADLHIHTVLSPCGDLDMSPSRIVSEAALKGLDIIGITDHNSTRQCALTAKLASEKGIFVLRGAEVTTKEEVHCLAFFENDSSLDEFSAYLDLHLPDIKNDPQRFGYQLVVDENEMITGEEQKILINAIDQSIDEVEDFVRAHAGLFILAHVDRQKNSIYSQLGFLPFNLRPDAVEISYRTEPASFLAGHRELTAYTILRSSDAHLPGDIGRVTTQFLIEEPRFSEIAEALRSSNGRKVVQQ